MKTTLLCSLALLPLLAVAKTNPAQDPASNPPTQEMQTDVTLSRETGVVTIASRGSDVREVIFDLFSQANRSFVLDPEVKQELFLALSGVQFDEALSIVCDTAKLQFEVNNDIYYISTLKETATPPTQPTKPIEPVVIKLTEADLAKKLTAKHSKTDIRKVFNDFSSQTGIIIDVDADVPEYKLDVFLIGTSLKFALDTVTKAADLKYVLTDQRTVRIQKK